VPGSAPSPAVKLSPNATITGRVSKFDGSFGAGFDGSFGAGFDGSFGTGFDGSFGATEVAFSAGADSAAGGAGRDPPQPNSIKPNATGRRAIEEMNVTQCHNKKLKASPTPSGTRAPAIQVSGLTKSIPTATHRVDILRGIDLEIQLGEFVAIMGPSGSGKSTLLGLLAGLDTPTSGRIILDGEDITGLNEDRMALLRGRKVGFVFQSYHLLPTLTAEENVLLPYELTGGNGRSGGNEGPKRARELLESVGLLDRRDHYPIQLSGGEQQRVALARAFMVRPPILLADEPTGNLDTQNGQHVLELLISLNLREGTTLVLVTHDPALSNRASRRITLRDGRIVSDERA
jgi:putative ABC transport system ATP-binding protein